MKFKFIDLKINSNIIWIALAIVNLVLIFFLLGFFKQANSSTSNLEEPDTPTSIIDLSTPTHSATKAIPTFTKKSTIDEYLPIFILSIYSNQKSQLYSYQPSQNKFTRLIDEPYEEIDPSLNPNQKKIAYSAKKNGYWDIYILDLIDGSETRVTDTPQYDGSPTWSPDGNYLAYESYKNGNLDIFIQNIQDFSSPPVQLTNDASSQYSPSWNPSENVIAFVSTQTGDEEIWLASFNDGTFQFNQISDHPDQFDSHPGWSSDGLKLIWTTESDGYPLLVASDYSVSNSIASGLGFGDFGSINSNMLSYIQIESNQNFLITKQNDDAYLFPPVKVPGSVHGLQTITLFKEDDYLLQSLNNENFLQLINLVDSDLSNEENGKLVNLEDFDLLNPYLNEAVLEPFNDLRFSVANQTGWDLLSQLVRTFIPITDPATPGSTEEWLYTGRAIEFNPLTIHAGLITTIKEERSGHIYWRIFVKARYQDGSQGFPLKQMPFDLAARYNNDPKTYDQGGIKIPIPDGYWVDLTELAQSQAWERLPALDNWQLYFDAARFNQFVYKDGLDWYTAMKELYPIEAIKTPTPIRVNTVTPTPSPTYYNFNSSIATNTPPGIVPTYRPTWTPNQ